MVSVGVSYIEGVVRVSVDVSCMMRHVVRVSTQDIASIVV